MLDADLQTLNGDMDEKNTRIDKMRAEITSAKYEERITQLNTKSRSLEDERDALNAEIRVLNLQADTRARLNLKRSEQRSKATELKNMYVFFTVIWL